MQRIAITGATGYIGGRLAPRLLDSGYAVRCLVRSRDKLQGRAWTLDSRVEIRQADLTEEPALAHELEGCDAAFYLVHSMLSAAGDYAQRDQQLALTFARAAGAAGVGRIIYLGGLGETGPNLSRHLSSRRDVEGALASAGVPVTVLRAAMIIGSGSASFEILRYLVQRLPVMVTPKWVSTPCQPIAVENVIAYLVGVLSAPATIGGVFDIGGPETLCYSDIMRVMAEELGLPRRWIIPIPVLTPRLSSYWIHLVTPLSHKIAVPLAEGLKNPVVCRDNRILSLVPQKLLTVREAIGAALSQVAAHQVETNWSMAGPMPGDPDWSGGTVFRDTREVAIEAPPAAAFRAVCRLGGGRGWYAANWLWIIRGWLDRLAGGPGLRRGRRDPDTLRYGDALDFWRVVGIEEDRRLSLRAEMRLPGEALLEFRIEPGSDGGCILRQTALFQPRGLFGLLYWYAVLPFHQIVFRGMLAGIRRDAMEIGLGLSVVAGSGARLKS
ncbi:MAG: SDR family oxidoreductase [Bryobacteraceae bacterium]